MACILGASSLKAAPESGRIDDAGVRMQWRYDALPEAQGAGIGRLSFSITDANTGSPLRYQSGQIAAWLQRRRGTLSDDELKCGDKVKLFATQGIGRRADIDLNTYRIITLNTDNSVAFINPFVGLNNAKLESIVMLPGKPQAWLHLPQRMQLWVRVSDPDRIVAIDTHRRTIVHTLDLPRGAPGAGDFAYEEGAHRLWLALPQLNKLGYLDLNARAPGSLKFVAAPDVRAVHAVAVKDGTALYSVHGDGRVQRWQGVSPHALQTWRLERPPREMFYSALADRVIVQDGASLTLLDPAGAASRRLPVPHAVSRAGLFDAGRYALAVGDGRMSLFDLASGALKMTSAAVVDAQTVVVTSSFAYAVGAARASLWSLADLRNARAQPVEVLLGSRNAPPAAARPGFARAVVSPAGTGLLAANMTDALIYQYAEGMMAPVGSYSNYKRTPLAMTILDLAPREVAPGQYVATVRHERGGRHELVVSGVSPRFAMCAGLALTAPAKTQMAPAESVKARLAKVARVEGARYRFEVALDSRQPGRPDAALTRVRDARLLVFDKRSAWQRRLPLRESRPGSGHYVVEVEVPRAATYDLFVSSATQNLSYLRGRVASVELGAP